jgi:hypothetical protein
MRLDREDIIEVARTNDDLQTILFKIKAKYDTIGIKYDFNIPRALESQNLDHKNLIPCYEEEELVKVESDRSLFSKNNTFRKKRRNILRTSLQTRESLNMYNNPVNKNRIIKFFKDQVEFNKDKLDVVLYEAWSIFRIVDSHFFKRQDLINSALRNEEIKALYSCK